MGAAMNTRFSDGTASRRRRSAQALVVAILVLFVMGAVTAVFIGIISRNLSNAVRSTEVVSAQYYAEAGIRFADQQLMYSPEGADWRPEPVNPATVDANDPDRQWLLDGYTRVSFEKGRALIRVDYDPQPDDPQSRFIRIRSVGRVGLINPMDPTTFSGVDQQRRELVAFKAIGITDYMRFITNRENRSGATFELGVPTFWSEANPNEPEGIVGTTKPESGQPAREAVRVIMGASGQQGNYSRFVNDPVFDADTTGTVRWMLSGAPIRVNGNLKLYGPMDIFLNTERGDALNVAGDIVLDHGADDAAYTRNNQSFWPRWARIWTDPNSAAFILPSASPEFSTYTGLVNDGRQGFDANGHHRSVRRLDPPIIDEPDPVSGVSRYITLTRESGRQLGRNRNTGNFGYGRGIYIANFADAQRDGGLFGGSSLRSEWLQPGSSRNWRGPYYLPPGAVVRFNPIDLQRLVRAIEEGRNDDAWRYAQGFSIELADGTTWRLPDGGRSRSTRMVCYYRYPRDPASSELVFSLLDQNTGQPAEVTASPQFDGVIFAEGNLRVSGQIPGSADAPGRQFTLVSKANIYIDGNLTRGHRQSALALLAGQNVVLNTTLFVLPEPGPAFQFQSDTPADPIGYQLLQQNSWQSFRFASAEPLDRYTDGSINGVQLLIGHSMSYQFAGVALGINNGILPNAILPALTHPATEYNAFGLLLQEPNRYQLNADANQDNLLTLAAPSGLTGSGSVFDYHLKRLAVHPMDIRVDATMYAQDGSFVVIPGEWMNTNAQDTVARLMERLGTTDILSERAQIDRMTVSGVRSPLFPFHGEPLDIRIRITGSIAEDTPLRIQEQGEWLRKWGWIPSRFGNSGRQVPALHRPEMPWNQGQDTHVNANLFMEYCFPQLPAAAGSGVQQIRTDRYGRGLPPMPRLPVCPGFVYYGEPG